MIETLIEKLNEQDFKDMFKPASEEELVTRKEKIVRDRFKQHDTELAKLPGNWIMFFNVINNKDSIVKLLVREVSIGTPKTGSYSKSSKYHVVFDVIFNIGNDIYVDTEDYVEGGALVRANVKFYDDVDAAARKYFGPKGSVGWNNTSTVGWIGFWGS